MGQQEKMYIKSFFKKFYFNFCLCREFIAVCGLSLVVESRVYSLMVCGLLIVVASLIAEHRLQGACSVAVAHGLSYPDVCGTFPDQGSNLCPPFWKAGS